tara:strand:+ start:95872 stop:97419 length:1548 start_codon:yes stop_codon:yes gene_type:complete
LALGLLTTSAFAAGGGHGGESDSVKLPHSIIDYDAEEIAHGIDSLGAKLAHRIEADPFNLIAAIIFGLAILHTFVSGPLRNLSHKMEHDHAEAMKAKYLPEGKPEKAAQHHTSFKATVVHFLGEIEAIFGIWCLPLILAMLFTYDWGTVTNYFDNSVNYTEPMFVVVIMAMASTRPILKFAEIVLGGVAGIGGRSPAAWCLSILIIAPLLGSFITEPAAMTIAALLLAQQFYRYDPPAKFKYATLGLLFVNISVGGTLTHFAAPPVLMVAGKFEYDIVYMFMHFGLKAMAGIVIATSVYFLAFKSEFKKLAEKAKAGEGASLEDDEPVPAWVTLVIMCFMGWTVFTLHHPALFIGGFLVFIAFVIATSTHQDKVSLKGPILVGFFLAGLVTHGGLQGWWIAPVLSSLGQLPLFVGATLLTAVNDNAAITYLASLVPAFDHLNALDPALARQLQYSVVSGAVVGGGLTVIANAPNPAGQSILQKHFGTSGVSPLGLLIGAAIPTIIMALCFLLLPH